jgi:hypothetical protein
MLAINASFRDASSGRRRITGVLMLRQTAMDLYKAIQDLYAEKEKLERVIASLEDLQRAAGGGIPPSPGAGKRRGRKSMGSDERQEVSERMKKYWASRRKSTEDGADGSGNQD